LVASVPPASGHGARLGLALSLCLSLLSGPALGSDPGAAIGGATSESSSLEHRRDADGGEIDRIVVYARRRAELLEDVPVSVTVLDQDELRVTETTRLDQLQGLVPNLSVFRTGDGQSASIVLRGVGNFPLIYFDQGVGLYVDGVYLSRSAGSILDLVDIERIEVLRGPQGTLFGKNTVGGAINLTTTQPEPELGGVALVRAGGFGTFDSRATLNIPLSVLTPGDLSTRLTFASFREEGYVYNALRDEYHSDRNSLNFLGTIRYAPHPDLDFSLTGSWSGSHTHGLGGQCIYVGAPALGVFPDGYQEACNGSEPYRFGADTQRIASLDSYGVWGILNWALPPPSPLERLSVKSTSAWREQEPRLRDDGDMTRFPVAVRSGTGGTGILEGEPAFQRQVQQEVQLEGLTWNERLVFVAGVFAFWEEAHTQDGVLLFPDTPIEGLATSERRTEIDNWDWALFGQTTLQIAPFANLTAGVRYTEEKNGLSRLVTRPLEEDPNRQVAVDFDDSAIFSAWSPMASLAVNVPEGHLSGFWLDDLMAYFSWARGFRGGGFNGGFTAPTPEVLEPFAPEFIDSFEIGLKATPLGGPGFLNISLFRADRADQQVSQALSQGALPVTVTRNAASSTTEGFETEFAVQPIDDLLIEGSVAYLDASYDEFVNAVDANTGTAIDRSGQSFPFVPRWQTHLGVQYSISGPLFDPTWLRGEITGRVDWSWQSDVVNWGPEVLELTQPAYHLVSLRLAYAFDGGRSEIAFFGQNLTDEEYFRDSLAQAFALGSVIRYYEPPRVFGVELTRSF
jgi:iron complex outermembrane recepter protein